MTLKDTSRQDLRLPIDSLFGTAYNYGNTMEKFCTQTVNLSLSAFICNKGQARPSNSVLTNGLEGRLNGGECFDSWGHHMGEENPNNS